MRNRLKRSRQCRKHPAASPAAMPPVAGAVPLPPDKSRRRSELKKANKLGVILPTKLKENIKISFPKVALGKIVGGLSQKISNGTSSSMAGLGTILHTLKREEDVDLPLVPAPPVSEIRSPQPVLDCQCGKKFAKAIYIWCGRQPPKTMRQRNRQIDASISHYAQAQSHESNETLYQNWGKALLARPCIYRQKNERHYLTRQWISSWPAMW